jgi:hypothetical protein
MRIGGDHAVGRRVAAVLQAVAEADGDRAALVVRMEGGAVLDLLAGGVVDAHGAELDLDRLAEPQHDLARRSVERHPALRRRRLEQRMRRGGGGGDRRDEPRQREHQSEAALHQASCAGRSVAVRRR